MNKHIVCISILLLLSTLWSKAQHLEITQSFKYIPNSSVLASYKNQFGSWEKDDYFPYTVIRVGLEGNANEVIAAKQLLHLNMGENTSEISIYRDMQNELLFLVPASVQQIDMTCGTGCEKVRIIDLSAPLQKNAVYMGRVHYVPAAVRTAAKVAASTTMRQFFMFRLTPENAIVSVEVDGIQEVWTPEEGIAYKMLEHGSYPFSISAEGYQSLEGVFVVSDQSKQMEVVLTPANAD